MQVPIINFNAIQFVEADGRLTPVAANFLNQLFLQMQQNLSNEGFVIPNQSNTNITKLTASQNGTLIYNTNTNTLQVFVNGSWMDVAGFSNNPTGSVLTTEG